MSEPIHTIAGDLPEGACGWPGCADPVCERNETGECPLGNDIIVECANCGAAMGLTHETCAACGNPNARVAVLDGDAELHVSDGEARLVEVGGETFVVGPPLEAAREPLAEPRPFGGPPWDAIGLGSAEQAGEGGDTATAPPAPDRRERGGNIVSLGDIVIVRDDARVIRLSTLRRLLEVAGDMRTLAEALGVSPSTISRALSDTPEEEASREERIRAIRELLDAG